MSEFGYLRSAITIEELQNIRNHLHDAKYDLGEAQKEIDRHHKDFQAIRDLLDLWELENPITSSIGKLHNSLEHQIRNIVG